MEKEDQIIAMLQEQKEMIQKNSQLLQEHGGILREHSGILQEHSEILQEHSGILQEHSQKLDNHGKQLEEHGQMLRALQSGQETLKAELEGFKKSTTEAFDKLKKEQTHTNTKMDVLNKDTWANKVDIQRVKNTMGLE